MISKKSQTYARALFESSPDPKTLSYLKSLLDIWNKEKAAMDFFVSKLIPLSEKKKLLQQILKSSPPALKNFFFVLLDNQAFSLLPEILLAYQNLQDEKEKTCRGLLYSSELLSEAKRRELEESLEKFFNKKIELTQKEDKNLIGGFSINVGGYSLNSTVKQELKRFKTSGG